MRMRKHTYSCFFFSLLRLVSNRKIKVNEPYRESDREYMSVSVDSNRLRKTLAL